MNGQIIAGTCIAVDFWRVKGALQNYVHFLTHVHGDHIVGLTSSWTRPIYCSSFTAQILQDFYGISERWLEILPLNQSVLVQEPHSGKSFCVTAFDANHCPGAVMLLFEGSFGNILHTGDFRFSSSMIDSLCKFRGKIDVLYIDNTFCSPSCVFPSQENCQEQIIEMTKQHSDSDILVGMRKLGKESLLAKIGVALNETVYVSPERYLISQQLFDCNVFSVSVRPGEGRIRAVPFHHITREMLYKLNQERPTIAILPSAIFTGLSCKPFSRDPYIHVVPYSDHSSFPELVTFVRCLQPETIIPIVQDSRGPFGSDISERLDMSLLKSYANGNKLLNDLPTKSPDATFHDLTSVADLNSHVNCSSVGTAEHYHINSNNSFSNGNNNATSALKRRKSFPAKRKRTLAKGVVFEGDAHFKEHSVLSQKNVRNSNSNCADTATVPEVKEVGIDLLESTVIKTDLEQNDDCDVNSSTKDLKVIDRQTDIDDNVDVKVEDSVHYISELSNEGVVLDDGNMAQDLSSDKFETSASSKFETSASSTKACEADQDSLSQFAKDLHQSPEQRGAPSTSKLEDWQGGREVIGSKTVFDLCAEESVDGFENKDGRDLKRHGCFQSEEGSKSKPSHQSEFVMRLYGGRLLDKEFEVETLPSLCDGGEQRLGQGQLGTSLRNHNSDTNSNTAELPTSHSEKTKPKTKCKLSIDSGYAVPYSDSNKGKCSKNCHVLNVSLTIVNSRVPGERNSHLQSSNSKPEAFSSSCETAVSQKESGDDKAIDVNQNRLSGISDEEEGAHGSKESGSDTSYRKKLSEFGNRELLNSKPATSCSSSRHGKPVHRMAELCNLTKRKTELFDSLLQSKKPRESKRSAHNTLNINFHHALKNSLLRNRNAYQKALKTLLK